MTFYLLCIQCSAYSDHRSGMKNAVPKEGKLKVDRLVH